VGGEKGKEKYMKRRQPKAFQIFKQCSLNTTVLWTVINTWPASVRRNMLPPSSVSYIMFKLEIEFVNCWQACNDHNTHQENQTHRPIVISNIFT
jgi:hypothetical protein